MKYTYKKVNTISDEELNFQPKLKLHKHDVWDFGCTLSPIILPMLIRLKTEKQGTPRTDPLDAPHISTNETEEKFSGFNEARWAWLLGEMIFAFDHIYREANDPSYAEDYFYATGVLDYIGKGLQQGPNHTYKVDEAKRKEFHDRLDNGFLMFGKYFQNLWT